MSGYEDRGIDGGQFECGQTWTVHEAAAAVSDGKESEDSVAVTTICGGWSLRQHRRRNTKRSGNALPRI